MRLAYRIKFGVIKRWLESVSGQFKGTSPKRKRVVFAKKYEPIPARSVSERFLAFQYQHDAPEE